MHRLAALMLALAVTHIGTGQAREPGCSLCSEWNQPQKPFRIYGNTYFVGPHGLSSILITSPAGHVLIDGALAESAPQIAQHIRELGFRPEDVKVILNSHVHHDHAGGIAALQRVTGAQVLASAPSAAVLAAGGVAEDDPQFGDIRGLAPAARVSVLPADLKVAVGDIRLQGYRTPGHTPGGTTWTWVSCEQDRCLHMVFADSVTAVSRPGYRFSDHPELERQFAGDFALLDGLPCDVLLTAHPEAADMWGKLQRGSFVDAGGCQRLAAGAREALKKRLASEQAR